MYNDRVEVCGSIWITTPEFCRYRRRDMGVSDKTKSGDFCAIVRNPVDNMVGDVRKFKVKGAAFDTEYNIAVYIIHLGLGIKRKETVMFHRCVGEVERKITWNQVAFNRWRRVACQLGYHNVPGTVRTCGPGPAVHGRCTCMNTCCEF